MESKLLHRRNNHKGHGTMILGEHVMGFNTVYTYYGDCTT